MQLQSLRWGKENEEKESASMVYHIRLKEKKEENRC